MFKWLTVFYVGLFLMFNTSYAYAAKWKPGVTNTKNAIMWAFCGKHYKPCWLGHEALAVSNCETGGTYSIWASNGWYKGLFQMGPSERAIWGFGNDPWEQALSAYRMYKWTSTHEGGPRWHRWACRPDGSVAY